jgi:hypothetical protein
MNHISKFFKEYLIGTGEIEKPSEKYRQEVVGQPLPFHDKPSSDVQGIAFICCNNKK